MLSDFLSLEQFYGVNDSAFYIEDLLRRYDLDSVRVALDSGLLIKKKICIGPDCGREMCWLSEKGREEAVRKLH